MKVNPENTYDVAHEIFKVAIGPNGKEGLSRFLENLKDTKPDVYQQLSELLTNIPTDLAANLLEVSHGLDDRDYGPARRCLQDSNAVVTSPVHPEDRFHRVDISQLPIEEYRALAQELGRVLNGKLTSNSKYEKGKTFLSLHFSPSLQNSVIGDRERRYNLFGYEHDESGYRAKTTGSETNARMADFIYHFVVGGGTFDGLGTDVDKLAAGLKKCFGKANFSHQEIDFKHVAENVLFRPLRHALVSSINNPYGPKSKAYEVRKDEESNKMCPHVDALKLSVEELEEVGTALGKAFPGENGLANLMRMVDEDPSVYYSFFPPRSDDPDFRAKALAFLNSYFKAAGVNLKQYTQKVPEAIEEGVLRVMGGDPLNARTMLKPQGLGVPAYIGVRSS